MLVNVAVELDMSDRRHVALTEWLDAGGDVADALIIGSSVVESAVAGHYRSLFREGALAAVQAGHDLELDALRRDVDAVKLDADARVERERAACEADLLVRLAAAEGELRARLAVADARYADLRRKQDAVVAEDSERERLRRALADKDHEIAVLKNSNHVKGDLGEAAVADALRASFPEFTVLSVGHAHPGSGDVWLVDPDGSPPGMLMLECKNKKTIERADIDKFYADVTRLTSEDPVAPAGHPCSCVGAVLVSLSTPNVPGKGGACVEVFRDVPVMFLGFADHEDFFANFARHVKLFRGVCRAVGLRRGAASPAEPSSSLEELAFALGVMARNKRRLDDLKTSCVVKLSRFVADSEEENRACLDRIRAVLLAAGVDVDAVSAVPAAVEKKKRVRRAANVGA